MDLSIEETLGLVLSFVILAIMGLFHFFPIAKVISNWI